MAGMVMEDLQSYKRQFARQHILDLSLIDAVARPKINKAWGLVCNMYLFSIIEKKYRLDNDDYRDELIPINYEGVPVVYDSEMKFIKAVPIDELNIETCRDI
ncbi:MAG: hypothetical protein OQK29_01385 [Ignavibacteriaceae bacterium]|nr:hypothetical protein [Ignavibacteriaceae bacterium]